MLHKWDLTDVELNAFAGFAGRIVKLLEKPQTQQNRALTASLDELLGAIYALGSAREEGFKGKSGQSDFAPILDRARQVANGEVKSHGNWMAGFHFNSAMFRISAVFDRLPKTFGGHSRARNSYRKQKGKRWQDKEAHDIREEVNELKHDALGLFNGRRADFRAAKLAVEQLLELAETLS